MTEKRKFYTVDYFSPDVLNRLFKYDEKTGNLSWRHRDKEIANVMGMTERGRNNFNAQHAGKISGYVNPRGYLCSQVKCGGKVIGMLQHRIIYAMFYNKWPSGPIDHIDGDRLNNKICNIRSTDSRNNSYNSKKRAGCTSNKIGVSYKKENKKWMAYYGLDKLIHLGYYETEEDAIKARVEWEESTSYIFRD